MKRPAPLTRPAAATTDGTRRAERALARKVAGLAHSLRSDTLALQLRLESLAASFPRRDRAALAELLEVLRAQSARIERLADLAREHGGERKLASRRKR